MISEQRELETNLCHKKMSIKMSNVALLITYLFLVSNTDY